jgi:endonuclease YncB( thermonuclease family)
MHPRLILSVATLSWASVLVTGFYGIPMEAQRRSPPVLVQRVIDGDSIEVATIGRVNLIGIAAPRSAGRSEPNPLAREAQQRLEGLLVSRWVRLEFEKDDAHTGRAAYVFLDDGRFVNAWMLREGLARTAGPAGLRRSQELIAAEGEAKSSRRGIWRDARRP